MRSAGRVFVGVGLFTAILFCRSQVIVLGSQNPASAAEPPAATSAQVVWLIFVDDLHLDFVTTGRLRDVLRTVASTLGEGAALIGVQSSGPSMASLPPSTDPVSRDAAIRRIIGHALRPGDFLVGNSADTTRELRYRAHTSLSAVYSAVESLARVGTPKKHILYVSNGFAVARPVQPGTLLPTGVNPPGEFIDDAELRDELTRVVQVSLDRGVAISALDPRPYLPTPLEWRTIDAGLWQRFVDASHATLRDLTIPTGGALLDGNQPLRDTLLKLRTGGNR
jgi:hypothetical protein